MSIKRQSKQKPNEIDISEEPYDKYLENLKYWKIKDFQTIIKTLQYLIAYKYQCMAEMQYISERVSAFHKQICKVNEKGSSDYDKVEVGPEYFEKVLELKARFKKLAKQGCFTGQKKIRSRFEQIQRQKKNLVNVNVIVPIELLDSEKQQYHRNKLSELYRSFVMYYPDSHNDKTVNSRVIEFLKELYTEMKKKCFYLKQKEYFSLEFERLCEKLKNQKFLENKRLMLNGEIAIREIIMNRISVFQNYTVKKKEQEEMMKILRQSEIRKQNQAFADGQIIEDNHNDEENTIIQEDLQGYQPQQNETYQHGKPKKWFFAQQDELNHVIQ